MTPLDARLSDSRDRLKAALLAGADTRPFRAAIVAIEAALQRDAEASNVAAKAEETAHQHAVLHRAGQIAAQALQAASQLPGGGA